MSVRDPITWVISHCFPSLFAENRIRRVQRAAFILDYRVASSSLICWVTTLVPKGKGTFPTILERRELKLEEMNQFAASYKIPVRENQIWSNFDCFSSLTPHCVVIQGWFLPWLVTRSRKMKHLLQITHPAPASAKAQGPS